MFNPIPATINQIPSPLCIRYKITPNTIRIEAGFDAIIFANVGIIDVISICSRVNWSTSLDEKYVIEWTREKKIIRHN